MVIYAVDGRIVFECEYCNHTETVSPAMKKRAFQTLLNRFYRKHDCSCKWEADRLAKLTVSATATAEIIKKLTVSSCR